MQRRLLLMGGMLMAATPVSGAERGYTVTDFDRIDIVGPVSVRVMTGKGPSARASGTPGALDRVSIEVRDRRLVIRPLRNVWGSSPADANSPVSITVSSHEVRNVAVSGTANVTIDRMRGQTVGVFASGTSTVSVATLEADRLSVTQDGSGTISLAGRALLGTFSNKGSGSINAPKLSVKDATLLAASSGATSLEARGTAKVTSLGLGSVTVTGNPSCTVNAPGGGIVSCGRTRP